MNQSNTIIISPSGNFYGSEQVLFDFLSETNNAYPVFVPQKGRLVKKLESQGKHKIFRFQNVKWLYLRIFFLLLARKVKVVYSNEGGHIKYLKALGRIFKNVKFVNHVRIVEDTQASRIKRLPPNVVLISISNYIRDLLNTVNTKNIRTIYDPYIPKSNNKEIIAPATGLLRVGIIGRVTLTKGLEEIISFCDFLEESKVDYIRIVLYGDLDEHSELVSIFVDKSRRYKYIRVSFKGFVDEKKDIYSSIDMVVHLSKTEPLGRIFFEALDYGRPIIGFNKGGIGEIATMLKIDDCMINDDRDWCSSLHTKITQVREMLPGYQRAKENYVKLFSASTYCKALEEIIL